MLAYSKAIGANTDVLTAQAFVFDQENQLLIILISAEGDEAFIKVRQAGLDSKERFFQSQASVGERIEELIIFLKQELASLEQFGTAIGFIEKDTLYIETINHFSVLLRRGSKLIELSRGLEDQKLISGILEVGDRVLFLSPIQLPEAEILSRLEHNLLNSELDNLEFEVETFIQAQNQPDPIATVLVENQIEKVESEELVNEEVPIPDLTQSAPGTETPREMYMPQVRLDGRRAKTPAFLLLLATFWQHLSKKRLILILVVLLAIFFGGKFAVGKLFKPKATPAPSAVALPPNTFPINNPAIFLDLNLVKDNFAASRLSLSLGAISVLDTNSQSLIVINVNKKQPQILAGPLQLGQAQFASINGDFIDVFSKDKGILKVDVGNGKTSVGVPPDTNWQKVSDLKGFANNVYLLDEYANQIWKYIATDTGFSGRNAYLNPGETADFAASRNLQIDGSVWVLKGDNTILKYTQGATDFFQVSGANPALDQIKSFYTSDDTSNIYFLDNENSRVVVTDKKGQYLNQYIGASFKDATDLVVDEPNKKLYLLEQGKIYQVDLK